MLMTWNDAAMDRLFWDLNRRTSTALPRLVLHEESDALSVQVELPGFDKEDVQIDLNHNTLTVRGQRRTSAPEGYATHRAERGAMSFARSFRLPCHVDADGVEATLQDGILELRLPKAAEEKPRTIYIN